MCRVRLSSLWKATDVPNHGYIGCIQMVARAWYDDVTPGVCSTITLTADISPSPPPFSFFFLKKELKLCLEDGCSNKAYCAGQLCQKHGGKPCSVDGCITTAAARGVVFVHGARGECKTINCATNAIKRGGYCAKQWGLSREGDGNSRAFMRNYS